MTSSIPDPRLEAATDLTYRGQQLTAAHARALLERVDAADEASGVRRVTGELHDALMRLYHVVWEETAQTDCADERYVQMTQQDSFKVTEAASAVEDILFPPAADSPVRGVS